MEDGVVDPEDVVAASASARMVALAVVAAGVAAGVPLIYVTRRYLRELTALAQTDPEAAFAGFRTWILPQVLVITILGVAIGVWLARTGLRARRTGRYPEPGAWVLHDTPVRRGAAAARIGLLLLATGVAVAAVPLLLLAIVGALTLR